MKFHILGIHLHLLFSFSQVELAVPSECRWQNNLCSSCRMRQRWRFFYFTPDDQQCLREPYKDIEYSMAVKYLPFDGCHTQPPSWTPSAHTVELTPNKFKLLLKTDCKWLSLLNRHWRQKENTTNPSDLDVADQQRCCHYTNEYSKRDFLIHTIFCCPSLLATRDYIPWVNETPEVVTSTPRWAYYEEEKTTSEKDTRTWVYTLPFLFMGMCFMAFPIYRKLKHKKGDVIRRSNVIQSNEPPPSLGTFGAQEPAYTETAETSCLSSEALHGDVPCLCYPSSQETISRNLNVDGLMSYEEALVFPRNAVDDEPPPPSYVEATSDMP